MYVADGLDDVVFLGEHLHAAEGEIVVAAFEIDPAGQLLGERTDQVGSGMRSRALTCHARPFSVKKPPARSGRLSA